MKTILILLTFFVVPLTYGQLKDGTYLGKNVESGKDCKIEISFDGDYLKYRRVEYRITVLSAGPRFTCKDYDNSQTHYPKCGSGENERQNKFLYMLLTKENIISRIYFHDEDHANPYDIVCENFKRIEE